MTSAFHQLLVGRVPNGATVLVVSRGDEALVDLGGRWRGWHFPRTAGGVYSGSHPADNGDAIALLEQARSAGGEFLLFPAGATWWLDHYDDFARYLEANFPPHARSNEGVLFDIRHPADAGVADASWDDAASLLRKLALDPQHAADVRALIAQLVRLQLGTDDSGQTFRAYQEIGLHVLPVHFYSPVPDTRTLPDALWPSQPPTELPGVEWNESAQLALLRDAFCTFRDEYSVIPADATARPDEFHLNNGMFEGCDALVMYCMIRHARPKRIVEVGSGFSSLLIAQAARKNGNTHFTCVEPYPSAVLSAGVAGIDRLMVDGAQSVPMETFTSLGPGDVLSIDSTHVVKTGSDVNYLLMDVLPRLAPGVIVHVHDIFLPGEYPKKWIMQDHVFWTEQYLLRALLTFSRGFEVFFANQYLAMRHPRELAEAFPTARGKLGASFWLRRT